MRLDTTQQLQMAQQMKLSPRIIQAMEILQLPVMALQERIDAEMEANPVLEQRESGDPEQAPAREDYPDDRGEHDMVVDESNGNSEDFERLAEFTDEYGPDFIAATGEAPRRAADPEAGDRKMEAMANTAAPAETLNEHLLKQWAFVEAEERTGAAGRAIINNLDDDGYLRVGLGDLAARSEGVTEADLEAALRLVQGLEPTGVGARDLQECLLIQLRAEADAGRDVSLETELVRDFLRDIEANRLPQIARRLGRSVEQIKGAIENLSHLNPRPGLLVGQRAAPVIRPEVIADLDDDGNVVVTMDDGSTPELQISRAYRRMADDRRAANDVRQFIRKNIRSAQWLIGAIRQRRDTVRRVAQAVFDVQRDFLEQGPEALKPLPMAEVARRVGVHVATVSRAVAGKYAQTPLGIFPLRMFFSGGTKTTEGRDVAWDAVKAKLKEVVDAEDKSSPLSDDRLTEALKARGVEIARRTVAKYRKLLGIPPARQRREY
ncbi:MAG: RNA polymerase factor sigma-54 [Planctomycetota bacterium]